MKMYDSNGMKARRGKQLYSVLRFCSICPVVSNPVKVSKSRLKCVLGVFSVGTVIEEQVGMGLMMGQEEGRHHPIRPGSPAAQGEVGYPGARCTA
jgi:hypothetical protein